MGNTNEVKELLEGGADVNEQNDVSTKFGILCMTLLHDFLKPTCRGYITSLDSTPVTSVLILAE